MGREGGGVLEGEGGEGGRAGREGGWGPDEEEEVVKVGAEVGW